MERKFDLLRTVNGKSAERPSLIYTHPSGGQLWLAGLPTIATLDEFPPVSLQVVCFPEPVVKRGGVELPSALVHNAAIAKKHDRDPQ